MKLVLSLSCSMLLLVSMLCPAHAAVIDLTDWYLVGHTYDGYWSRSTDKTSVTQGINGLGDPTFFVSDATYSSFEASVIVKNGTDTNPDHYDDFIGIVFGWTSSTDYYLLDWKGASEGNSWEGFTLSKISGSDVDFWTHSGDDIEILGTCSGDGTGWELNLLYSILVEETAEGMKISIKGSDDNEYTSLFALESSVSGQIGFYCLSQRNVTYQAFTTTSSASAVPEPSTFLLLGAGLLGLVALGRKGLKK